MPTLLEIENAAWVIREARSCGKDPTEEFCKQHDLLGIEPGDVTSATTLAVLSGFVVARDVQVANYGDITTPKKVKVYHTSEDWAEVVNFTDRKNYHLRYNDFDEICVDGELTIYRSGILIQKGPRTEQGTTNSHFDVVICACLGALIGENFSGYEHNYEIRNNLVYDEDED